MFTGLIREIADINSYRGALLSINATHKPGLGDSIAVNGVCLTVVSLHEGGFALELSSETSKTIATENLRGRAHIEPAMRLVDRVEGHIVQGHVDTVGEITGIEEDGIGRHFIIKPLAGAELLTTKGSIAIDGVSLTINEIMHKRFRVTIIPHTFSNTLFADYTIGRRVNIEYDIIVKSLYELFAKKGWERISWEQVDRMHSLF